MIVLAAEKRAASLCVFSFTFSLFTKKNWIAVSNFSVKSTNIGSAFIIWPLYGSVRLSFAIALLIVPPIPSHALFPWDVAKKCHSHVMPVSGVMRDVDEIELFCIAPRSHPKINGFCSTPVPVSVIHE